ncbi:MoxR family ATPase [Mesorhizobium sp. GbtcB19]|uniref:AAA family ATPase n=1 Tax=Mesorhizobium sp. GbtcB19 TaxID=2824764 RepID=UPI001C2F8B45|nr:MoxR family ATPase [Mesorhizobium sp. GbtcB19]
MSPTYKKIFDPASQPLARMHVGEGVGDRSDPSSYVFSDKIVLAINVALAAGRPLLVRGPSGTGKSSLARSVARHLGWSYFEMVVTSRTEARDFLWRTDHLKRLRDAQVGDPVQDHAAYTTPGALFWGFDPKMAINLLKRTGRAGMTPTGYLANATGAVVLIDENDKAEPDVPNSLLEPFGTLSFDLEDLGQRVSARNAPFVMVTTNEERDLPQAFLRRCVELEIDPPGVDQLVVIAQSHFPESDHDFLKAIAQSMVSQSKDGNGFVSTAEYLDTIRACVRLGVNPSDETFRAVSEATGRKRGRMSADTR